VDRVDGIERTGRLGLEIAGDAGFSHVVHRQDVRAASWRDLTTVRSDPGRLLARVVRRARTVRRGRATALAAVRVAQPVQLRARITRRGRSVATLLRNRCVVDRRRLRWSARHVRPGRYVLELRVRSDRPTLVRRLGFVVSE
jgi:hypothetical protein